MKNRHYLLTGLCLFISTQVVFAEKHKMEQHGSHEHGAARLTVATTDDGLEIALESPAANLFGFEHKAKTTEQRELVHEVTEKLEAGSNLFSINDAAGCTFASADVESAMEEEKHADEKHDDHDDDHKDEKHAEEKHDDHDDDHKDEKHADEKHDDHDDDHKDEEKSHSDVDVTWTFKCTQPAAITSVSTKLFSAFPKGFEEIDVEWITASGAGKTELEKDGTITLKQ